jgi:DNA polymerase III subunit chi
VIVDFYHLTASPLEKVLPRICERLLAEGGRLLIVAEPHVLDPLDEQLWCYVPASFIPHGRAGGASDERQPIILAETIDAGVAAPNIAIADGIWREEALKAERVFFFFDEGRLHAARPAWTALKQRHDVERRYWKQDAQGRWLQGP